MKKKEVIKILEENKITNVIRKNNKDKRTPSEKLQDEIEPIPYPCPMHEDYDEINDVEKGGKINEKITQSIQGKVIYLWNFKKEWKAGLAGKGRAVPGRILYSTFGI